MSSKGSLRVQLNEELPSLKYTLTIDVWDNELQHCSTIKNMQKIDLKEGTYQITSVLSDGHVHKKLVEIKSGKESMITLGENRTEIDYAPHNTPAYYGRNNYLELPIFITEDRSVETQGRVPTNRLSTLPSNYKVHNTGISVGTGKFTPYLHRPLDINPNLGVEIDGIQTKGVLVIGNTNNHIFFESEDTFDHVPKVEITFRGLGTFHVSLPLNRKSWFKGGNTCSLEITHNEIDVSLYAKFSPESHLSFALQNMLRQGKLLNATNVARDASDLLWEKYEDPIGATLGALILFKIGALKERKKWLKNLALNFNWIPDGQVLLSHLLAEQSSTTTEALKLAIDASEKNLLFTDSFSILLNLLKNWPYAIPSEYHSRYKRNLDRLNRIAVNVDWAALTFTYRIK